MLISCTTTKPIKAEELESTIFTVNHISFTSNTLEPEYDDLFEIFQLLPYQDIVDLVYEETGLYINTSLIRPENIDGNIEYCYLYNERTDEVIKDLPTWELNFDTDDDQLCELIFEMNPPESYLDTKVILHTTKTIPSEKEGKEDKVVNLQTKCAWTFIDWTYKNIFIDPRSCAQVTFNKHIQPMFIDDELFSVYSIVNTSEDGFINVNTKDFVTFRCNIYDPGNMFVSPAEIYNAYFDEEFQPGKKYKINYKIKRHSPNTSNWQITFTVKEIKPKQTKD